MGPGVAWRALCSVSRPGRQQQEEGESVLLAAATVTTAELQHRQWQWSLVLQKVPSEANPKVRNHREGPY